MVKACDGEVVAIEGHFYEGVDGLSALEIGKSASSLLSHIVDVFRKKR